MRRIPALISILFFFVMSSGCLFAVQEDRRGYGEHDRGGYSDRDRGEHDRGHYDGDRRDDRRDPDGRRY